MSTIRVKVKCWDPSKWYFDQHGLELNVVEHDYKYYRLSNAGIHIAKSDCSIVPSDPESPQEFKEGQWLFIDVNSNCDVLFRFINKGHRNIYTNEKYTVIRDGEVHESYNSVVPVGISSVATPEQIERILSAVAVSKGFVKGCYYLSARNGSNSHLFGNLRYIKNHGLDLEVLTDGWGGCVYHRGAWAKIVDQDKPEIEPVQKTNLIAKAGEWIEILDNGPKNNALDRITINTPYQLREDLHTFGRFKIKKDNDGEENGYECSRGMKFKVVPAPLESLPERWAIQRTKQNYARVNKWFNQHTMNTHKSCMCYVHYPSLTSTDYTRLHEGYTLITDEQFDKWVLNKPENTLKSHDYGIEYPSQASQITFKQPQPPIMEDKAPLTIEEKKEIWNFVELHKTIILRLGNQEEKNWILQKWKDCSPLFYTTIDGKPIWYMEKLFFVCEEAHRISSGLAMESLKGELSASTREACERWINDNRMVKEEDVLKVFDTILDRINFNTIENDSGKRARITKAFKEELSKLTGK